MAEEIATDVACFRAVAYYRQSTTRTTNAQRDQVRTWAVEHRFKIIREFTDDGIPSESVRRSGLEELIAFLSQQEEVPFILCVDASRLWRCPDALSLEIQLWNAQILFARRPT